MKGDGQLRPDHSGRFAANNRLSLLFLDTMNVKVSYSVASPWRCRPCRASLVAVASRKHQRGALKMSHGRLQVTLHVIA